MKAVTFDVSDEVLEVLRRCKITEDRVVLPGGQLDRSVYVAVDKVLKAAGGKWDRKAKTHVFERDPREVLKGVLEFGIATKVKQTLQQFYTPPALASLVVKLARVRNGNRVLEPSAGEGALAIEALRVAPSIKLSCYEFDSLAIERLGDNLGSREVKNTERIFVEQLDFLQAVPFDVDRVIMNPPFRGGQDMDHVLHALKFLIMHGTLVAVIPSGTETGDSKRHHEFWTAVAAQGEWKTYMVPSGAFKSSGTMANTRLLRVVKTRA